MYFTKCTYNTPPSAWTLIFSLNILAVILIGGIRSIWGTVIGAFVVFGVPDLILKRLPVIGGIDGMAYIFNGILIIVVILFYPTGLVSIKYSFNKWRSKLKKGKEGYSEQ